jgi:hypothetical protein
MLAGVKTAVTPAGRPVTESATLEVNPATGVTVTVSLPLPPGATVSAAPPSESAKGAGVIVNATVAVLVAPPKVIEKVTGCAPTTAAPDAASEILTEPGVEDEALAVRPAGSPEMLIGSLVSAPAGVTVSTTCPLPPCGKLSVGGAAVSTTAC